MALLFQNGQKVQISGVNNKVQIVLAGMFFTDSYIEGGQIGDWTILFTPEIWTSSSKCTRHLLHKC